jgi:hypothetical protein
MVKARARQQPEELRRLAVEALGDPGGPHQQLLRRLRLKLRVGPQEGEERGKLAL